MSGLMLSIPVIFIGSFSLLIVSLPVEPYQNFISSFAGGIIKTLFSSIHKVTLGALSIYMAIGTSARLCNESKSETGLPPFVCISTVLACFLITVGFLDGNFKIAYLSGQGMFSAIVSSIIATTCYNFFDSKITGRQKVFSNGMDTFFNYILNSIAPAGITISIFAAVNALIIPVFKVECFQSLFIKFLSMFFRQDDINYSTGIIYLLFTSLLWFIGLHGGNIVESIVSSTFTNVTDGNILSKTFLDVFSIMGGCGTVIGLLIAILLFAKHKPTKRLALLAAGPIFFNINELILFGLPVIFNTIFLLPFIVAPLATYSIAFIATKIGLVPYVTNTVEWTTPVLISGYLATGSIRGSILQLVNIAVSVMIYCPFVIKSEKIQEAQQKKNYENLINIFKEHEKSSTPIKLLQIHTQEGNIARNLISDFIRAIDTENFQMKYQPQMNEKGECIGAEALLRWKHPFYNEIYPPLIVSLTNETENLWKLEKVIIKKAMSDYAELENLFGKGLKLSINVTVDSFHQKDFFDYVTNLKKSYNLKDNAICFEITEEMKLKIDDEVTELFKRLKNEGFLFALDDFTMGHTSIQYLQKNIFNFVKLDGSIVKDMISNPRSKEIVSSIVSLSNSLNFNVIAEYVETKELQEQLHETGCNIYQGYLYSPAVSISEIKTKLEK